MTNCVLCDDREGTSIDLGIEKNIDSEAAPRPAGRVAASDWSAEAQGSSVALPLLDSIGRTTTRRRQSLAAANPEESCDSEDGSRSQLTSAKP